MSVAKQRSSLAALVVVLLVIAAVSTFGVVKWKRGTNEETFVGDSITDLMRGDLEHRFRVDDEHLKAVPGKTLSDMSQAAQELGQLPAKQAVVNLGTNDALKGTPADQASAQLLHVLGSYPNATCVHAVTINERMITTNGINTGQLAANLNTTIRQWAAQDPARHKVVDWAAIVVDYDNAGKPEGALTFDTVHPTDLGKQKLIDAYDRSLASCNV